MTTEIIVIIQQQNARLGVFFPIEPGRRQAADARPDHHQVVVFLDLEALDSEDLLFSTQLVRHVECTGVAAAQTTQGRRVIRLLQSGLQQLRRRHASGDGDGRTVEKIAPSDAHRSSKKMP